MSSDDGYREAQALILRKILEEFDEEREASRTAWPESVPGLSLATSIVRMKLAQVADRLLEEDQQKENLQ